MKNLFILILVFTFYSQCKNEKKEKRIVDGTFLLINKKNGAIVVADIVVPWVILNYNQYYEISKRNSCLFAKMYRDNERFNFSKQIKVIEVPLFNCEDLASMNWEILDLKNYLGKWGDLLINVNSIVIETNYKKLELSLKSEIRPNRIPKNTYSFENTCVFQNEVIVSRVREIPVWYLFKLINIAKLFIKYPNLLNYGKYAGENINQGIPEIIKIKIGYHKGYGISDQLYLSRLISSPTFAASIFAQAINYIDDSDFSYLDSKVQLSRINGE